MTPSAIPDIQLPARRSMFSQQTFHFQAPLILPLVDDTADLPENVQKKENILQKFNRFHARNPHVYYLIVDHANRMKQAGIHKFGMKGIFEYLRWQYAMQTQGDPYKLNNNYTAFYARMVMEREAGLRGFFETRRRLTE